ncbi:MAG: biopolymer transporter ExbD [Planctomycetota bacterium]
MAVRVRGLDEPALNLTPMIDVVFLLIIFFMVGSRFTDDERQLDIRLPTTAETLTLTSLPDPLTVSVDLEGGITLDGETVSAEQLEQRLAAARANYAGQAVVVRGDRGAAYQRLVDALAICRKAKIENISLALTMTGGERADTE